MDDNSSVLTWKHPAFQLYEILGQLLEVAINHPARDIARLWLDIDRNRQFDDVWRGMILLLDEWEKGVSIDTDMHAIVRNETLATIERVQKIVYDMRQMTGESLTRYCTDDLLRLILLSSEAGESVSELTLEDLTDIHEQVTELQSSVRQASLSPEVKADLLSALWDVQNVIQNYELFGDRGLTRVIDTLAGSTLRNTPDIMTEQNSGIRDRIRALWWQVISKFTGRVTEEALDSAMETVSAIGSGEVPLS